MSKVNIQKLPSETINKLGSGIVITDAVQCVLELVMFLVYNSLDAQATAIVIILDLKNYKIQVADNGLGLSKVDLSKIGERFMTSKYQTYMKSDGFSTYGYKGQAIPSLLDVCKIFKIETKTKKDKLTSIKVFQNKVALPITQGGEGNRSGTTVTAEDFMWSMPVRRKRMNEFFDLEEIKMQLKYLAVVHHQVSFTLKNESKGFILFQSQCTPSMLSCIKNIFSSSISKHMRDVSHKHKNYEITGFASKKQMTGKYVQLLYINKRLLSKGMTHKVVNDLMDRYGNDRNVSTSISTGESFFVKDKRQSSWAFILEISCPIFLYEIFTNIRKSTVEFKDWKDVLKALQRAIQLVFSIDENITFESLQLNKKNKEENVNPKRRKQGTSLLVNAIKGAPVKRHIRDKQSTKKNKMNHKKGKTQPNNCATQNDIRPLKSISIMYTKAERGLEKQWTLKQNYCLDQTDSLESPIPKKKTKISNAIGCGNLGVDNDVQSDQNQSFLEFYRWLKRKVESDSNAFKFYKSFLEFKETDGIKNSGGPQFNSNGTLSTFNKKLEIKEQPRLQDSFGIKDGCMVQRRDLNLEQSKMKRDDFSDSWRDLIPEMRSTIGNNMSVFKFPSSNLHHWINERESKQFPAGIDQPELLFSNYLDSRDTHAYQPKSLVSEKRTGPCFESTTFNTLFSHHQHSVYKDKSYQLNVNNSLISWVEKRLGNVSGKMFRRDHYHSVDQEQQNANIFQRNQLSDDGKNITEGFATSKKDAMVQTDIPKAPIHLPLESIRSDINTAKKSNCMESRSIQSEPAPKYTSQKVQFPNFWNKSVEKCLNSYPGVYGKKTSNSKETESDQFVWCSQAENAVVNAKDGSSFQNTISCIWTDSLSRLQDRSSGGHYRPTDSTGITQTVPIEDIDLSSLRLETPKFHLTSRLQCVPKGLSPCVPKCETIEIGSLGPDQKSKIQSALESCDDEHLACVKWQKDDSSGEFAKPAIPDTILEEMRQKAQKTMINCESEILTASLPYCAIKVHNLLHSFAFTKELLAGVEIIGQLDKKFIVAKMMVTIPKRKKLITLFDQHALDERIKLEEIMTQNVLPDGKILSTDLKSTVECELNESLVQVLSELNGKIINLGIGCRVIDKKTISIDKIPAILAVKHCKEIEGHNYTSVRKFVRSLIGDAVNEFTQTRGALSQVPKIMHNLFCSEACHSAIKFNKALTEGEMSAMVNKLKNCKVPFQCAHGRPSVIPIIDLEDFHESMVGTVEEINLEKLQRFKSRRSPLNSLQGSAFNT